MMIIKQIRGDIFSGEQRHIAFAANIQGRNNIGFSELVAMRFWPEIRDAGTSKLGDVISHKVDDMTYHALVCYSLEEKDWSALPNALVKCLNNMCVPEREEIAIVLIGAGPIGQQHNVSIDDVLTCMKNSSQRLVVYTR